LKGGNKMEIRKAIELEKKKHEAIGEICSNLTEIVSVKDMEEIREFVKDKVYEKEDLIEEH